MVKSVEPCKKQQKTAKNSQKPCFFVLICCKYGFASLLSPQKRNFMSEIIFSTNILLVNDKKCEESFKKQQNIEKKKTDKNHVFLSETAENMGLHHCLFPQKRKFTSEMIVSTNILLINAKKCVES